MSRYTAIAAPFIAIADDCNRCYGNFTKLKRMGTGSDVSSPTGSIPARDRKLSGLAEAKEQV